MNFDISGNRNVNFALNFHFHFPRCAVDVKLFVIQTPMNVRGCVFFCSLNPHDEMVRVCDIIRAESYGATCGSISIILCSATSIQLS
jgi:hypothetical protein